MSEQSARLRAGGQVITDAMAAHARGELSDHVVLGWRLATTALTMKPSHQLGAVKIARDYAEAVGIDFDVMVEQIEARIYEAVQFELLTADREIRAGDPLDCPGCGYDPMAPHNGKGDCAPNREGGSG